MKKIISLSLISGILFFSCASSKVDEKKSISDDIASDTVTEISETDGTEEEFLIPSEETEQAIEELVEEDTLEEYVNLEEKIPQEDLETDLSLLEEEIEESEIIETISDDIKSEEENTTQEEIKNAEVQPEKTEAVLEKKVAEEKIESVSQAEKSTENEAKTSSLSLQDELSEASEKINSAQEEVKPPVPSRDVSIRNNEFLDINYPGTGWIYLGEVERKNLLVFYGRKITDGNTTFTLQSRKPGTAILHFYKNDTLSGKYIDDYVEVTVGTETATDNTHAVASEYAKIVPPKPQKPVLKDETVIQASAEEEPQKNISATVPQKQSEPKAQESELDIQTIIKTNGSEQKSEDAKISTTTSPAETSTTQEENEEVILSGDLLEQAQKAYDEKKYEKALTLIKAFLKNTADRIDEGLFLEGAILEAKSPVQNIKKAISDYDNVVQNWPMSRLWKKANERSIYLKRFYIDIR